MRRIFKLFLTCTAVMALSITATLAAQIQDSSVKIDPDSGKVTINGVHSDGKYGFVTVSVSRNDVPYYWSQVKAGEDGGFLFTYTMDENDNPGIYEVIIGGSNISENISDSYPYLSETMKVRLLEQINKATEYTDVEEIITEYGNMFDVNSGEGSDFYLLTNKEAVWTSLMGKNFGGLSNVKTAFDVSVAIESFNEGEQTIEELLVLTERYAKTLGIAVGENSYYKAIGDDSKKIGIAQSVIKNNLSLSDPTAFCKAYNAAAALCVINSIDSTNRNLLISYIEKINQDSIAEISLASYNALSGDTKREYAIKKVTDGTVYNSFDEFASRFEKACYEAKNYNPYSGGGGGGSSSGGGSGSSGGGQSMTITYNSPEELLNSNKTESSKERFTDLSSVSWANEAINTLAKKGIIDGVGDNLFLPNGNVTRAEFVKMLTGALNILAGDEKLSFRDVNENMWQYEYVAAAASTGIIEGISDTEFGVNNNITREDMCTMLWRAVNFKGIELSKKESQTVFSDENAVSDYAISAVKALSGAEIVNGYDDNSFAPKAFATRAMAAKVIFEIMKEGGLL